MRKYKISNIDMVDYFEQWNLEDYLQITTYLFLENTYKCRLEFLVYLLYRFLSKKNCVKQVTIEVSFLELHDYYTVYQY